MPPSHAGSDRDALEDPFDGMSSQSTEIDDQLALEMEEKAIRRVYQDWATKLTSRCEVADRAMSEAWGRLQAEMVSFRKQKRIHYSTLKKLEGRNRATRVIRMGLDEIVPATYKEIVEQIGNPEPRPYVSPPTFPQHDESLFVPQLNLPGDLSGSAASPKRPGPAQEAAALVPGITPLQSTSAVLPSPKSPPKSGSVKGPITVSNGRLSSQLAQHTERLR